MVTAKLDAVFSELTKVINDERDKLLRDRETFEEERSLFETERDRIEELASRMASLSNSPDRIKLNIGGTLFVTTVQTLSKEPTMLSAMFLEDSLSNQTKKENTLSIEILNISVPF
eukprot:TRINITY_DN2122_c0_g1_i1.p2 TRINITY_DN2122_c0_g1~~TRINITY_DN2122_c0_g1_i1.p2  ORF type:complete len:116 (+),score=32.13 TRINITY_DN2122_c0_g1_i1:46-393(+)